jgi:hypothetical protein
VAPNEEQLSTTARTPAEVFMVDPDAVIELAKMDAETRVTATDTLPAHANEVDQLIRSSVISKPVD